MKSDENTTTNLQFLQHRMKHETDYERSTVKKGKERVPASLEH